jgi:Putative abortive phage resistance protein AbiGi, antitoxin
MDSHPTVSSNTLFHITPKRKFLLNILENNFRPRYCTEDFSPLEPKHLNINYTFPMTCFCDIPLSLISKHFKFYGNYGIGLTKDWGKRNRLNPVLYLHKDSYLWKEIEKNSYGVLKYMEKFQSEFQNGKNPDPPDFDLMRGKFVFQFFIKPYEGEFKHNNKVYNNVRFYDEREWRFYPTQFAEYCYYYKEGEISTEEKNKQGFPIKIYRQKARNQTRKNADSADLHGFL